MPLIFKKSENEHQKHAISNPRRVNCGRLRIIRSFFSDRWVRSVRKLLIAKSPGYRHHGRWGYSK